MTADQPASRSCSRARGSATPAPRAGGRAATRPARARLRAGGRRPVRAHRRRHPIRAAGRLLRGARRPRAPRPTARPVLRRTLARRDLGARRRRGRRRPRRVADRRRTRTADGRPRRRGPPGGMLRSVATATRPRRWPRAPGSRSPTRTRPSQFVLTGTLAGIDAALGSARELGLRAKRLASPARFTRPRSRPRSSRSASAWRRSISVARAPVLSCVTAAPSAPIRAICWPPRSPGRCGGWR